MDSVGSESLMRDPAEETGVRRRQLSANTGGSLKRSREGEFWVGSQESQGHGHQPGADGGCRKGGDTEEGRLAGNGACEQQSEAGTFHFEILTCVSPIAPCSGQLIPTQWAGYQRHQQPQESSPEDSLSPYPHTQS